MLLFRARRYDNAIRTSQLVLDLNPNHVNALWWLGASYAGKRDFPKAAAALTKALKLRDGPLFRGYLGYVYEQAGEIAKARGILKERLTANLSEIAAASPTRLLCLHHRSGWMTRYPYRTVAPPAPFNA